MPHHARSFQTCCFFGHRQTKETKSLKESLSWIIEDLILNHNVSVFLFGSRSKFDNLCYAVVSQLHKKYPFIRRIYVRAEYPYITDEYRQYLLQNYEDTYFPEKLLNSHKAVYLERNIEMIDRSKFCIVYYDPEYISPQKTKSGTAHAYRYAKKKNLQIINARELSSYIITGK